MIFNLINISYIIWSLYCIPPNPINISINNESMKLNIKYLNTSQVEMCNKYPKMNVCQFTYDESDIVSKIARNAAYKSLDVFASRDKKTTYQVYTKNENEEPSSTLIDAKEFYGTGFDWQSGKINNIAPATSNNDIGFVNSYIASITPKRGALSKEDQLELTLQLSHFVEVLWGVKDLYDLDNLNKFSFPTNWSDYFGTKNPSAQWIIVDTQNKIVTVIAISGK